MGFETLPPVLLFLISPRYRYAMRSAFYAVKSLAAEVSAGPFINFKAPHQFHFWLLAIFVDS